MTASTLELWNLTWRSGLACENAISFASSISSLGGGGEGGGDRVTDGFGDRVELAELVARVDLLAQVAQEVLLAGHPHEVRVGVAVAHVVERVFVAQLLVAGLAGRCSCSRFRGLPTFSL